MNDFPRSHLAVRHTRMLLIRAGLNEDEADTFLDRLANELTSGRIGTDEAWRTFVERELAEIKENQRKATGTVKPAIVGLVTGLASSALYDLLKSQLRSTEPPVTRAIQYDWQDIVQIEWASTKPATKSTEGETLLKRALQICEQQRGTFDKAAAIYLDGIGLFLDANGNHRAAEKPRRQALKISRRVSGHLHESTGAALSNLGLCFLAQRRHGESEECLTKSVRMLMTCLGTWHLSTAAAIYNLYICLKAQGRLKHVMLPPQFIRGLPAIQETAEFMMHRKAALVSLVAAQELLAEIKSLAELR